MNQRNFTLPALLGLALAACQQPDDTNITIDNQVNAAEAANAEIETLPPSDAGGAPLPTGNAGAPTEEAEDDSENSPSTAVIPAQYRGRWGINTADCDPKRSYAAKGLMTVRDNSIRFYESTASLQEQRPAIATSFSGTYSFIGEGQSWERVVTLTRTGNTLKRADSEGSFSYIRCP